MSINQVTITGNLGADPEIRNTASGMCVMQLRVAVNERRKNGNEWEDYTNWIPCTMFGTRAEAVSKFLHKGSKVGIAGKLHYSQWKNKDGESRSKLEIVVNELELLTPRNQGSQGHQKDAGTLAAEEALGVEMQPDYGLYDESIPF